MLNSLIDEILVTEEEIDSIVTRLAGEISRDYADKNLVLVSVLKGSIMFTIDLAKKLLECKELSVLDVACLCGFEDIYYFSKTFKKVNGQTASNFRKHI